MSSKTSNLQKGKKEKRHKRKKNKKAKGAEDNSGPVQISKVIAPMKQKSPSVAIETKNAALYILYLKIKPPFLFQYLKDRDKGKYSMISGKKIKMKVKKSKKDKQVNRHMCPHNL